MPLVWSWQPGLGPTSSPRDPPPASLLSAPGAGSQTKVLRPHGVLPVAQLACLGLVSFLSFSSRSFWHILAAEGDGGSHVLLEEDRTPYFLSAQLGHTLPVGPRAARWLTLCE